MKKWMVWYDFVQLVKLPNLQPCQQNTATPIIFLHLTSFATFTYYMSYQQIKMGWLKIGLTVGECCQPRMRVAARNGLEGRARSSAWLTHHSPHLPNLIDDLKKVNQADQQGIAPVSSDWGCTFLTSKISGLLLQTIPVCITDRLNDILQVSRMSLLRLGKVKFFSRNNFY